MTPATAARPPPRCPPRGAHSAVIGPVAVWRAWYLACTSGPKNAALPRPCTWAAAAPGIPPPADPPAAGQLDPLAAPAACTAAPNTWPAGLKPAPRKAANSPDVSEDPHVPLDRIPAIRALATAGSSCLTLPG